MAPTLVLHYSLRSVPFNLFVGSNSSTAFVGSPFVSSFWSHVKEQFFCWKKWKEEGSMIAFLLKRNNWTKIVLQQADFYCGERKKNGVSPIDIKRFKGRMFSNPLLVVFAKVPKFRETKYGKVRETKSWAKLYPYRKNNFLKVWSK